MPGITGVINLSQIYSLHSAIPSFRNRSYSRYKVIPGIRHIYTWNSVIPPFRNRPLVNKKIPKLPATHINLFSWHLENSVPLTQRFAVRHSLNPLGKDLSPG